MGHQSVSLPGVGIDARAHPEVSVPSRPGTHILATRDDVMALLADLSRLGHRDVIAPLAVRLPEVGPSDALRVELRLNQAAQECGCTAGSQFMTVGATLCVAYLWTTLGSPFRADLLELLSAGAVVLAAAITGKLVGLARARHRLLRELRALAARAELAGTDGGG